MSVSSAVAAAQRQISTYMMPDYCWIENLNGTVSDGAGGSTGGDWQVESSVRCQVTTASSGGPFGQEEVIADGIKEVVDATIIVPAGTDVDPKQHIVHREPISNDVTTYQVVSVSKPTGFQLNLTIKGKVITP